MTKIILLAEHDNNTLNEATLRVVTAANIIGDVDILVVGSGCDAVAQTAAKISDVNKVLMAEDAVFTHQLAEPVAALLLELAPDYDVIMSAATSIGKSALPRVAALLDVAQISEIIEVVSPDTFIRPIYAGNALQKVRSDEAKKIITVRPTSFDPAKSEGNASIETLSTNISNDKTTFVSAVLSDGDRVELVSAKTVISGGRAFGSKEKFDQLLEPLAQKLNAAIGASRAAVDAGYAPNEWQVGQTGKVVAPDLYIAIGISGAIQHLAGMKDSKTIVAINSDPDAPINQIADYVLIADLFMAVPELTTKL